MRRPLGASTLPQTILHYLIHPSLFACRWSFGYAEFLFHAPHSCQNSLMLNLIKLCVGVDSLQELADWQAKRLKEKKAKGQKPELIHVTRQMPKRAAELLDGGSLYWVIKGQIMARQTLLELREVKKNGVPHCGLVYDKKLVPVRPRPRRAFQGWRYFEAKDAPPDIAEVKGAKGLPEALKREL